MLSQDENESAKFEMLGRRFQVLLLCHWYHRRSRPNIVRPFGRPCWMVFIQHFLLDQVLDRVCFWSNIMPNNLLDGKMLQRFAALPTKLNPEASHVGHAGQSRIAILFSGLGFSRHLQQRWRTKRTSWLLMNSQKATTSTFTSNNVGCGIQLCWIVWPGL